MKTTMRKSVARIITLVMVLAMMMSFAVPAMATSTHNQKILDAQKAVVNIEVVFVDSELGYTQPIAGGTGFFINEDTLITCNHLVNQFTDQFYAEWAEMTNKALGGVKRTAKDIKENLELRVAVLRDVYVKAHVKKASTELDFAILTLEEKIYDRTTLPLRKSSSLLQTEQVYALGFPGIVSYLDDQSNKDAGDVTSTGGIVNKITRGDFLTYETDEDGNLRVSGEYKNVDVVEHGARITGGFSGGPLVDADGNVVGVNAVGNDVGSINMAVSMDPILQTLNALGIEYTAAEEAAPVVAPVETVAPTEAPVVTEAPTEAPVAETEAPTVPAPAPAPAPAPEPEPGPDMTTILIIAAVAVVAVIVVIVVVMGKKKKPVQQTVYSGVSAGQTAGFQTNSYTAPMGAGETTVLGGNAGETTILGRGANGGTLIRKRTNETIAINTDRFVIGRERKTSNYCVADNSSVSRSHVTLSVRGGTTFLMDMNAANGTFVNGVKVMPNQEVALKNGDRIKLSDEEFEFRA